MPACSNHLLLYDVLLSAFCCSDVLVFIPHSEFRITTRAVIAALLVSTTRASRFFMRNKKLEIKD
jgi:hypothetical protein